MSRPTQSLLSGVQYFRLRMCRTIAAVLILAPLSRSSLTTSRCPACAARFSAVRPYCWHIAIVTEESIEDISCTLLSEKRNTKKKEGRKKKKLFSIQGTVIIVINIAVVDNSFCTFKRYRKAAITIIACRSTSSHCIVHRTQHDITRDEIYMTHLVHDVDVCPSVQEQPCYARVSFRRSAMQCYPADLKIIN
jgi:hypothetical protein